MKFSLKWISSLRRSSRTKQKFSLQEKTVGKKYPIPFIELEGEVDHITAMELKQAIRAHLKADDNFMIVGLEKVVYLDSTALGVLIGGMRCCQGRGGNLPLVITQPRIRRVFEITGLDKIFEIHRSVKEAIRAERDSRPPT